MNNSNNNSRSKNKLTVPGARQAIDKMKWEIANELGVNMGPDATSRANGSVGGEITKRLVQSGMQQLGSTASYQSK
jgi:small acid-soluble spore protein A (major alpha-type SASP)